MYDLKVSYSSKLTHQPHSYMFLRVIVDSICACLNKDDTLAVIRNY